MKSDMYLHYFSKDEEFPIFIQYGHHEEEMFVHTHKDFSELVIILGGSATHTVNGEDFLIKKGDVFVINDNTSHGYKNPHQFRICNIMFRPGYFLPAQNDMKSLPGYHALFVIEPALTQQKGFQGKLSLSAEAFEEMNQKVIQIHHEYTTRPAGYQTMITSLFLQMVTQLSRLYNTRNIPSGQDFISFAGSVAYMETHFREEISIDVLASMAGMSTRHFRRIFHGIYGISPLKYINTLRIHNAKHLLVSTQLPITEIAIRCGFCDGNYFSSKFRQATGTNPSAYRQQYR